MLVGVGKLLIVFRNLVFGCMFVRVIVSFVKLIVFWVNWNFFGFNVMLLWVYRLSYLYVWKNVVLMEFVYIYVLFIYLILLLKFDIIVLNCWL